MKGKPRVRSIVQSGAGSVQQEASRQQRVILSDLCGNVVIVLETLDFALAIASRYITQRLIITMSNQM